MNIITKLRQEIKEAEAKIEEIQETCSHPSPCVTSEYGQATCEYGTTVTSKWEAKECSLCEKKWVESLD